MSEMITPFDLPSNGIVWRSVAVAPAYEVSEYGHVRRQVAGGSPQSVRGLVLRPRVANGYARYSLRVAGKYISVFAHRLVAIEFLGELYATDKQVAHWDGVRENCHYTNLRWATVAENIADRERHGRTSRGRSHSEAILPNRPRGENHPSAKITEDQAKYILRSTEPSPILAARFNVTRGTINHIRRRATWRHL